MKFLVLTALIAAVASGPLSGESNVENPTEWPYKLGKLYRYDVESYTLARLQEGASSGNAFKARFIIRVKAPGRLQARLENPQHALVHQQLPSDRALPVDLKYQPILNLDQPFEINVDGGRVMSLTLPSALSLSQENLLKGLIGALQVDLSANRIIQSSENTYDKQIQQGQFKKMETDVTGDCETLYTVLPVVSEWRRELPNFSLNEEPIEITKSKNYGYCHHRVAYHFGVPQGAEWTGTAHSNRKDQFIKRATTSRILVGKQGPIFKTETTSTVHVNPQLYGKQKAEVLSYVKFDLNSYEQDNESDWQIPEENRVVQSLLYSMTTKQVAMKDKSSSSSFESTENEYNQVDEIQGRVRRSLRETRKIVAINKVIINKHSDVNSDSSSSDDSTSAYINDEIPKTNEPAYAALYLNSQSHADKKQNPMNAQKLVQEIAQQLQNPNNMPKADFLSKFNILVRVIAGMSSEQLSQTSRSIEVAKSSDNIVKSDMWMIYRDAVTQAGTLPVFKQIQTWIQSKKIQGEEAAEVVATLVNTMRYPTKEVMTQFFNLAMSIEVSEQQYLNSTALLAATRFINMGQVNNETAHSYYPTHMYGRLARKHDNFVLEEILPRLRQGLEQAIQQDDSHKAQVYIKAIGNLAHRSILEVYAPYLEGKIQVSNYLRALMVENLQVLAHQRDSYARAVLFNILRNTAEPYEVRVAAILNIFVASPTSAMMQAMAQMTHDDPSIQVRAALKSGIVTAAELKLPRYWELARTAQAASSMLTKEKFGKHFSARNYDDHFDNEYELGIIDGLSYIGSEDNLFPKYLKYGLKSKSSGWHAISASVSSVQQFIDYFKQQMSSMWQPKSTSEAEPNHKYSANKISEMLNIKHDSRNPLEAALYINLMNQQRYFTFSEEELKQLPVTLRKLFSDLSTGVNQHYTKVFNQAQVSVMFPVAMGMPFIYKYKEPTVIHIQAKAQGQFNFPENKDQEFSASIEKQIQFTFARNIDGSVGFFDTLSNQYASAGVVSKVQLNIPVKVQMQIKSGETKIYLEPLQPEQDTTITHFSVWPYTANQKKDTLVPISLDSTTKIIDRSTKVHSLDTKFGQSVGTQFQFQGYSYSLDYKNIGSMFKNPDLLSNIALIFNQKDVALTHYNLRYLGKQSQNKGVTFTAVFDTFYNQKQDIQTPFTATTMQAVTPNSAVRRQEMIKHVVSDINTAKGQVIDLSATFEGLQKSEYVFTAAIGESPVDDKIKYAVFAGWNSPKFGNNQMNAVGTVIKPKTSSLNFIEALKQDLKMKFDADIKFGQNGNIHLQGYTERSQKYAEVLEKHPLGRQCAQQITSNNYYQHACYKMIVMAHAPDYLKASVTYKDLSPAFKYMTYQVYKFAEYFNFWYTDVNPLKTTPDGKLDIEVQTNYLENNLNMVINSRYGEVRVKNVPIPVVTPSALSTYTHLKAYERVMNYYHHHQYQPYCSVDGSWIKTFSNRNYQYTLTKSWHVVMQEVARLQNWRQSDELVVLARKPNELQQEIYISYKSGNGQALEIEIQPALEGSNKPKVKVNTNSKKVSDGDLTMYWNEVEQTPLLQYFTQPDGVLLINIHENRLRAMYDGQRLVVLSSENRNTTRGICGYMNGEPRDDYLTPKGLVDQPEHFAASYALTDENSEPKTLELQAQALQLAYQPHYHYTAILRSDNQWMNAMRSASSSEENWGSQNVYRSRSYSKLPGECQLLQQVQYYENHGEICITTTPLDSCQSNCIGEEYKIRPAQVVCRPKLDQQFQQWRNQIRQGQNPQVSGVPQIKQYKVPTSCRA